MDDRELFKQAIREAMELKQAQEIDPGTGLELAPGCIDLCPGVDECCDECDHYLTCFPEFDAEG